MSLIIDEGKLGKALITDIDELLAKLPETLKEALDGLQITITITRKPPNP